ncbi:c-type cytochrome [Frateuria sp. GZRe12]|uniref:c-type cytochrome n=1 Tax=Frateuria sp. GZRe12 TaxID=3351533 RepID=UPI003EDBA3CF
MKRNITQYGIGAAVLLAILVAGGAVFVYSGLYNIGADDHHTRPVFALMQALRERSIAARSKDIAVPDLEDPQRILKGAGQYAAMCTDCHLKPGMEDSEIRPGLYPQPPNLSRVRVEPQAAFWTIKHGVKMSAMPAWGTTHDDPTIWSMVAFLQKLPDMTAQEYEAMVAKAPPDEDMDMGEEDGGHQHGDEAGHVHHQGEAGSMADDPASTSFAHADATVSLDGLIPRAAPDAEATAQAFHGALEHGDRAVVLGILAPEATITEAGQTRSRDAYATHQLDEDLAFMKKAEVTPLWMGSVSMGGTAMVGSAMRIVATDAGKPRTLHGKERLTLKKLGSAWKITAVQWQTTPETRP